MRVIAGNAAHATVVHQQGPEQMESQVRRPYLPPRTISLAHVVLVSLGDHQVTRIIRPNVQAGYNSLCQPPRVPYRPSNGVLVRMPAGTEYP